MGTLKRLAEYQKLVEDQQAKIDEYKEQEELYLECSRKLIEKDAEVENQLHVINTTRKTLERLTKENEHLKQLLIGEWNV